MIFVTTAKVGVLISCRSSKKVSLKIDNNVFLNEEKMEMKCLLFIMLPVILLGAMSKEEAEPSVSGPEVKGRRVMPLVLSKFNEAYETRNSYLLKEAVLEVIDFCQEEYNIEERFMSLEIRPYVWKKADGGWEVLSDSESSDTQGLRACTLINADPAVEHWVLRFFVRQECFREIEKKCERIQQKFKCRRDLKKNVKASFLLSSFFSLCSARDIEITTQL